MRNEIEELGNKLDDQEITVHNQRKLEREIKKIEMPTIGASASLNNVKRTQKPLSLLTQKKLTKIKR